MKTNVTKLMLLAAALSGLFTNSITAAPKTVQAHAARVGTVHFNGWEISRGMPARTMVNRMGAPDTKLSVNVWIYQRFHAVPHRASARECRTLVVTLVEGVVTDLHMVNDRAQAIITARVQAGAPAVVATAQ